MVFAIPTPSRLSTRVGKYIRGIIVNRTTGKYKYNNESMVAMPSLRFRIYNTIVNVY
jgi:hypothetical protein